MVHPLLSFVTPYPEMCPLGKKCQANIFNPGKGFHCMGKECSTEKDCKKAEAEALGRDGGPVVQVSASVVGVATAVGIVLAWQQSLF